MSLVSLQLERQVTDSASYFRAIAGGSQRCRSHQRKMQEKRARKGRSLITKTRHHLQGSSHPCLRLQKLREILTLEVIHGHSAPLTGISAELLSPQAAKSLFVSAVAYLELCLYQFDFPPSYKSKHISIKPICGRENNQDYPT